MVSINILSVICALILFADQSECRIISVTDQDLSIPTRTRGHLLTPKDGCGISNIANSKIVGGTETKPGQYPWMVLLIHMMDRRQKGIGCGGSLITSRHVLTAAHCISPSLTFVRIAEHDYTTEIDGEHQDIKVVRTDVHPDFEKEYDLQNDIAILTLEGDVIFNDRIRPICLPLSKGLRSRSFVGSNPFVAGWGDLAEDGIRSDVLMHVQLPVIDNAKCKELYRQQGKLESEKQFDDRVVCAGNLDGGQDVCHGDSGGPLMIPMLENGKFAMYQIGLVSDGIGCARKDAPGFYTSVQFFMDWIQETVKKN